MGTFFSTPAEKFIKKLKLLSIQRKILGGIGELDSGPFSLPYKKLAGHESTYRIRIGDYRVTYEADVEIRRISSTAKCSAFCLL